MLIVSRGDQNSVVEVYIPPTAEHPEPVTIEIYIPSPVEPVIEIVTPQPAPPPSPPSPPPPPPERPPGWPPPGTDLW